ncbi:MAG: hypothetical protein KDD40_05910 [Bdellovibrionales bacterium]|nr:hypothetical protein [Bdellovibrionales bacterium]
MTKKIDLTALKRKVVSENTYNQTFHIGAVKKLNLKSLQNKVTTKTTFSA